MSVPAIGHPSRPDRLPTGRQSGLVLAASQRSIVEEIARRAADAAQDYTAYAQDRLYLASLAARVPAHMQARARALVAAHTANDLAGLARLYRPGR